MKLIKLKTVVVNVANIAWATRDDNGKVTLHMCLPAAKVIPIGTDRVAASDHHKLVFSGSEADQIWSVLTQAADEPGQTGA